MSTAGAVRQGNFMAKFRRIWEFKLPTGATFPLSAEMPEGGGVWLPMIKIELGPPHELRVLIDQAVTMWVHFVDDRTVPCFGDVSGKCDFCGPKCSRRWVSYLAVWAERSKSKGIVALPMGACQGNQALRGKKSGLVGGKLTAWRSGGHIRGPVKVKLDLVNKVEVKPEEIVSRHDLLAQLFWIMGVRLLNEDRNGYANAEENLSAGSED